MADRIRACDRRRERSFPPPSGAAALSAWLVAFSATPLPRCIGCDLQPITADAHAAPASFSFLAGVTKIEHAVIAFPYAGSIYIREQLRSAVRQGASRSSGCCATKYACVTNSFPLACNRVRMGWRAIHRFSSSIAERCTMPPRSHARISFLIFSRNTRIACTVRSARTESAQRC